MTFPQLPARAVAPVAAALLAVTVGAAAAVPLRDRAPTAAPDRGQRPPCAILLHGLGRTARSMTPLARALQRDGYVVANIDYPSREQRIEALAAEALPRGLDLCRQAQAAPIHVVTHSMGGILTRHYLGAHEVPELGRVVMLGPPNRGSAVADRLMDTAAYRRFNGPAGQQLGTGPDGIAAALGPVRFPLGVLAGRDATLVDDFLSRGLPGEGDGKVLVAETRVEGMSDFRVLDVDHTFMMRDPAAIAEVRWFLREGRFSPRPDASGRGAVPAQ